jgi:large subunit ribosomal protein L30
VPAKIHVTWYRSDSGQRPDQRKTLIALGLHRLNETVVHNDTLSVRGMINKVRHLVKVEVEK